VCRTVLFDINYLSDRRHTECAYYIALRNGTRRVPATLVDLLFYFGQIGGFMFRGRLGNLGGIEQIHGFQE